LCKTFKTDGLRVFSLKHAAQNIQNKEFTRKIFQNKDLDLDFTRLGVNIFSCQIRKILISRELRRPAC